MDWIFQEAYKVVQQRLGGTLPAQQIIPLLTIIILFGGLLKRRQIAEFISQAIKHTREYLDFNQSRTEIKLQQAAIKRIIGQIEEELVKVEGHKTQFDTKLNQAIDDLKNLSTSQPIQDEDKERLQSNINDLDKFYQYSLGNFRSIEALLKDIAEVRRGDVLINHSNEIAESAVEKARKRRALKKQNLADSQKDDGL